MQNDLEATDNQQCTTHTQQREDGSAVRLRVPVTPQAKAFTLNSYRDLAVPLPPPRPSFPKESYSRPLLRKPESTEFFQVHPDWEIPFIMLNIKGSFYLVPQELKDRDGLPFKHLTALLAMNTEQQVFFIPIRLPGNGRLDGWAASAAEVMGAAKAEWVRMFTDQDRCRYRHFAAQKEVPGPDWSTVDIEKHFNEMAGMCLVDSEDHPILKQLEGRA